MKLNVRASLKYDEGMFGNGVYIIINYKHENQKWNMFRNRIDYKYISCKNDEELLTLFKEKMGDIEVVKNAIKNEVLNDIKYKNKKIITENNMAKLLDDIKNTKFEFDFEM
jgi:hypothetical protein